MFKKVPSILALLSSLSILTFQASALANVNGGGMPTVTIPGSTSTASPGGSIGSLSWDGSSDYIENSANGKRYLQLGLLKNYTYQETVAATSSKGKWSDFHLATIDEAYDFANAISSVKFVNNPSSPIDSFTADTKNTFADGVLGSNYNSSFDRLFFLSDPNTNQVGTLILTPHLSQIYFSEIFGTYDALSFAKYAQFRSQETTSWLVVSNYTLPSAVPEPKSLVMFLAGLGLLGIAVRRNEQG